MPRRGFVICLLLTAGLLPPGTGPLCAQPPEGAPPLSFPGDLPAGEEGTRIRAGWAIFDDTWPALRAAAQREGRPYAGNSLACRNCHLDHGTRPGALPLGEAAERRYSPREGRVLDTADRINACVQRALNTPPLPAESPELVSLVAYLSWLRGRVPGLFTETEANLPDRPADPVRGEAVYGGRCADCHDPGGGAPPLWGAGSYGTGSGLNRLSTATRFLRAAMPPDDPLEPEEAYDAAAFLISRDRPRTPGLDRDYPALTEKPADCAYPPFPDDFEPEQYRYGPLQPILESRALRLDADRWLYWVEPPPPRAGFVADTLPPEAPPDGWTAAADTE